MVQLPNLDVLYIQPFQPVPPSGMRWEDAAHLSPACAGFLLLSLFGWDVLHLSAASLASPSGVPLVGARTWPMKKRGAGFDK